jgi:toxin ParE1/3/4
MKYKVLIAEQAENDIISIYHYIAQHDSIESADYVFANIEKNCLSLRFLPNRGRLPPELKYIGMLEYREIHFKIYRIIYRIVQNTVYVHSVLDGRQNLQIQLEYRFLR